MRKKLLWLLLLVFVCLLAGCSEKKKVQTETKKKQPDIVVGTAASNAPYYSVSGDKMAEGLYVELVNLLSKQTGMTFEFREISPVQAAEEIREKNCDIYLGNPKDSGGQTDTLSESQAFYRTNLCLAVLKNRGIEGCGDLRNQTIVSAAATRAENWAKKNAVKYEGNSLSFTEESLALSDLEQGYSKAVVLDENRLKALAEEGYDFHILKATTKLQNEHRMVAFRENESAEKVFAALDDMIKDGTLREIFQ